VVSVPRVGVVVINDICEELFAGFGGVLAEGLGPETVAMRVVSVAIETDVAGAGDELFDATEIGVKFGIGVDAEEAIFKGAAEAAPRVHADWHRCFVRPEVSFLALPSYPFLPTKDIVQKIQRSTRFLCYTTVAGVTIE